MIAAVMLMSVALVGILCVVAYTLATYALPLMLGFAVARFAYHTGSGLIGASFIGLLAAAAAFAVFAVLFATCGRQSCVSSRRWSSPRPPPSLVTRWSTA